MYGIQGETARTESTRILTFDCPRSAVDSRTLPEKYTYISLLAGSGGWGGKCLDTTGDDDDDLVFNALFNIMCLMESRRRKGNNYQTL